jgi:hypothetical protein
MLTGKRRLSRVRVSLALLFYYFANFLFRAYFQNHYLSQDGGGGRGYVGHHAWNILQEACALL